MTLREGRNLLIILAVVIFASGCASMEHTGSTYGANVKIMDGVWVNTNQIFKKKKQ